MERMLTVKDISEQLGIGINQAYALVKTDGFPAIQLNSKYLIPQEEFEKWVKQSATSQQKIKI